MNNARNHEWTHETGAAKAAASFQTLMIDEKIEQRHGHEADLCVATFVHELCHHTALGRATQDSLRTSETDARPTNMNMISISNEQDNKQKQANAPVKHKI